MTVGRSSKGTVWNIQILRFVAAAMVLYGHLNHEVSQRPALAAAGFRPFEPVWWPGGVDIFFVISGFIMYYISADAFGRPGASLNFLERRIIRLVPPYWGFTILALIAMALVSSEMAMNAATPWQAVASFLFIPAANPNGQAFPILVLGWTLNFEMLFYLFFAIGLQFGRRTGVAVIAALLLLTACAFLLQPLPLPLGFWANTIVIEFLFGIMIAILYQRGVRLPIWLAATLAVAAVIALLLVRAADIPGSHFSLRFLWAGGPALLLVAGLALVRQQSEPVRISRLLVYGGDTSYALYLSHPFTLSALAMVAARIGLTDPHIYVATGFSLCVVAAGLFYTFVEKPVYTWLTRARRDRTLRPAMQ